MACIYGVEQECSECRMCGRGTVDMTRKAESQTGSIENLAALQGILCSEIIEQKKIWGMPYECYTTKIEVKRESGVSDFVPLVIPKDIIIEGIEKDTPIMCWGKVQALLERKTGKLGLFVLVEHMEASKSQFWEYENDVQIIGEMSEKRTYRKTPKGKRITDFRIGVPEEINENPKFMCRIPSLCWNTGAEIAKRMKPGQRIKVCAKFQSREYSKVLKDGKKEIRTAYELSVNRIESLK